MIGSYVAYSKATRPTGRMMAKELACDGHGIRQPAEDIDTLVRWGSSRPMPVVGCEINTAAAIKKASDKIASFEAFLGAGVQIPPYSKTFRALRGNWGEDAWYLARSNFTSKGRGIIPFRGYEEVPVADFYTLWIQPRVEYRIHVVDGSVVRTQGKYCDDPIAAEKNPFVRNHENGYRYRAPKEKLHRDRNKQAIAAVKALGLDFGAVDLLLDSRGKTGYILEVNTGPACSPLTAKCYAAAIASVVRDRTDGACKLAPGIWDSMGADDIDDTGAEETYLER